MSAQVMGGEEEELELMDPPEPFQEPTMDMLRRHKKRTEAAGSSAILGLPGDVVNTVGAASEWLSDYIPDILQSDPLYVSRGLKKVLSYLPTSSDIKESMIAQDPSIAPQNEWEEMSDEIVGDALTLALPVKGKVPLARAVGTSVFSNMAKEISKQMGGSPNVQAITKIGSMFVAGLVGRPSADKTVKKLYDKADDLLPEGAFEGAGRLKREAAVIQKDLARGASTPTKEALGKFTNDVLKNVDAEGNILMENVAELRRNLNEIRGDPMLLKSYAKRLNSWDAALTDVAETYGQQNSKWFNAYNEANSAFGALKKSDKAVSNILKAVEPDKLGPHTSLVLGIGGPSAAAGTLGAAGVAGTTATGYRIMQRFATNPSLRRHYTDIVKASLADNSADIVRSVSRLDKELKKSLEKDPIPFLDFED